MRKRPQSDEPQAPKNRLQFEVEDQTVKEFDETVKECRAASRAEIFRKAFSLLRWVLDIQRNGGEILVRRHGEDKPTVVDLRLGTRPQKAKVTA